MEKSGKVDKQHNLWYHAALLAPITHAASGIAWPAALGISFAAMFLVNWAKWGTGWWLLVQKFWASILVGIFLQWSRSYWTNLPLVNATPLVLLVLIWWTVSSREKASRIGCVLIWPVILLLGAVLLSGVSEIRMEYLKPEWKVPNPMLLALFMVPRPKRKKGTGGLLVWAVAVSIITVGVLSRQVAVAASSGIYELSRSLSLLGIAERFESLVAAAMTLGFYCSGTYLLEKEKAEDPLWGYVGIAALTYLSGLSLNGWILTAGSALVWVLGPVLQGRKNSQKRKKGY